ncbi:hypothetical protein Bint_0892 [Brachyspira intermedia PWS/A]|uniref:Uncharacterized protein n=1 Tax=Brachyspira intermedia (strain ATCC 51140 / PWS/A) TaxID=1045858 RepID=G0ELL7_BRAIP|nr:hypothetical protein Bint_0892 [Brachyspira intermedia PWS/A]
MTVIIKFNKNIFNILNSNIYKKFNLILYETSLYEIKEFIPK